ncbi:MAG TPA: hypothetical protein VFO65_06930 [Acidimicrobiales bacterium]|nr:hypothetical protein [Acidimicrobiales bacterium]
MASSGSTFNKIQREREKKERAAAKRERRQERASEPLAQPAVNLTGESELGPAELVRLVEAVHRDYEAGTIDLDEFEEAKRALLARVRVD